MGLLPVQSQPFYLYGSGVVIGNTTMVLSSLLDINGNLLTMSNFGTVGTGTVEPGNGSLEEQIIFTGITQNANGTATLTGISSVGFESPYTLTSGFTKNHFGNVTFTLSDTAYLYSQYANLGASNTFTGTDTFTISPFIPTVSSSQTTQAASIGYVNSVSVGAGAVKASNTVFGISELSVAPVTASVPIAVGQNDPVLPTASEALALVGDGGTPSSLNTYITQQGLQAGSEIFAIATGGSIAYAISLNPVATGYVKGERVFFQVTNASGTSPTLNKNSLGAKSLYKWGSTGTQNLAVGDLGTNQMCIAEYDGGGYQVLSPITSMTNFSGLTNAVTNASYAWNAASGSLTIAHGLGVKPKYVRLTANVSLTASTPAAVAQSVGFYNGSVTAMTSFGVISGTGSTATTNPSNIVYLVDSNYNGQTATVTSLDATNLVLAFTKVNTPSVASTIQILLESYA